MDIKRKQIPTRYQQAMALLKATGTSEVGLTSQNAAGAGRHRIRISDRQVEIYERDNKGEGVVVSASGFHAGYDIDSYADSFRWLHEHFCVVCGQPAIKQTFGQNWVCEKHKANVCPDCEGFGFIRGPSPQPPCTNPKCEEGIVGYTELVRATALKES